MVPSIRNSFTPVTPIWRATRNCPVVPFLLNDIALDPKLMQADGFHPNELGQPKLLANVWPALKPLLRR